jgi:hypothetical protein
MTALAFTLTLLLGGVEPAVERVSLPPGHSYRLRRITATADAPYCISVLDEHAPPLPARALALGCFKGGEHSFKFSEPAVRGDWRRAYAVVAWSPAHADGGATVLAKIEIAREKP